MPRDYTTKFVSYPAIQLFQATFTLAELEVACPASQHRAQSLDDARHLAPHALRSDSYHERFRTPFDLNNLQNSPVSNVLVGRTLSSSSIVSWEQGNERSPIYRSLSPSVDACTLPVVAKDCPISGAIYTATLRSPEHWQNQGLECSNDLSSLLNAEHCFCAVDVGSIYVYRQTTTQDHVPDALQ